MNKIIFLLSIFLLNLTAVASPISGGGQSLTAYLDKLDVEHRWRWGEHVDWKTGQRDGKDDSKSTSHCSAFVAGATEGLNIYVLRPPEHKMHLLANAQYQWLKVQGAAFNWFVIRSATEAQQVANRGCLVIAAYQNPNPAKHGHIAIVRPSEKADALIQTEGPQVIQAGNENYSSTSLLSGFSHHLKSITESELIYYGHATAWCSSNQ